MIRWRFDQGRLDYFQFDEIKNISKALYAVNGIEKPNIENDFIRESMSKYSERPFLPENYTVWRNYGRVFECQLLATAVDGKIICTDLCANLANESNEIDVDDYLRHFSTRFYYPSPIFDDYQSSEKIIFPVISIIKLLIARLLYMGQPSISFDEICMCLIANQVTGLEPIEHFRDIKQIPYDDDPRQARELVKFISQFSFLKWRSPFLYLEVSDIAEAMKILKLLEPNIPKRIESAEGEILNLGSGFSDTDLGDLTSIQTSDFDREFTEGKKVRITHLKTERSTKLKEFYFESTKFPHVCNMCSVDTISRYPWANRLIEVHHLLPLSSPVRVENGTTSIKDVVGLCPSCHRATHKFYTFWLKNNDIKDFRSYSEARDAYQIVKSEVKI